MTPAKLAVPLLLLVAAQLLGSCWAAGPSMRGAASATGEASVLDLVEQQLGVEWRQATEALVSNTSDIWQTMYKTLPKNEQGSVDAASTQYALNRFFMQRYRWRVRGLALTGTAWGDNTSLLVVEDRMPAPVREYFQDRVFNRGVVQHDLAVLAATIELLIRDDAKRQLKSAYEVLGLSPEEDISADRARDVVAIYTTCYASGFNVSEDVVSEQWWRAELAPEDEIEVVHEKVNGWIQASPYPDNPAYSFPQVQAVVEVALDSMLQFVHNTSSEMKGRLMTFEGSSSGRVSLSEFYQSYVDKGWTNFDERKEFLQQLGVLDESDPAQTRVIVPNYLLNPLNCAGPWGYYATCSINECEFLMSDLERELGGPEAAPGVIAEKVEALPSGTTKAPRALSSALVRKLEEVAEHHNGKVPIHGRLFFQWMHFAYPLECPYPFPSGTVRPMSETQFQAETGFKAYYSVDEIKNMTKPKALPQAAAGGGLLRRVQAASTTPSPYLNCDENEEDCLAMWTPDEELVQHRKVPLAPQQPPSVLDDVQSERAKASSPFSSALRFLAMLATVPAFVQVIRQHASASLLACQLLSGRMDDKKGHLP